MLIVLAALLIMCTVKYGARMFPDENGLLAIDTVQLRAGSEEKTIRFPCKLSGYKPGEELRISFQCEPEEYDILFFGTVYSPLSIILNGTEIYSYGASGTYPGILREPPTKYDSVKLTGSTENTAEVEMIYTMPETRRTLTMHAPLMGSEEQILASLFRHHGSSMLFSVLFLIAGTALAGTSLFFHRFPIQRRSLLFSGLLMVFAGAWQFGENTLSNYLLQLPVLLYMMDFIGLFLLVIPLVELSMLTSELDKSKMLQALELLLKTGALSAMLLQVIGIIPLHQSLFFFQILLPLSILLLTARMFWAFLHSREREAALMFVALLILMISAVLELVNYRFLFIRQFSSIFQMGLFAFMLAVGAYSIMTMRDVFASQMRGIVMENEIKIQDQAIIAQVRRNEMLLSHFEEVRRQRHDIRHHLRTVDDLLRRGDIEQAKEYVRSVTDQIHEYHPETFCDNVFVNSTMCFYFQQAIESQIQLDINVQIPNSNANISDANLCVIFGNILENAIEACKRLPCAERWIRLRTSVSGDMLFICMDNSFSGEIKTEENAFLSTKHSGRGSGLLSVQTIAERHDGSAAFRVQENVFQSEVCVKL